MIHTSFFIIKHSHSLGKAGHVLQVPQAATQHQILWRIKEGARENLRRGEGGGKMHPKHAKFDAEIIKYDLILAHLKLFWDGKYIYHRLIPSYRCKS